MTTISMTIRQAADSTGLSEATIRKAINAKQLTAKRIGVKIILKVQDLELWVDSLEDARD
jgi:excisionase family DNA binding protein